MTRKEMALENSTAARVPVAPVILGWLIPGGGHFLQRRWGRGLLLFASIAGLFLLGVSMHGHLYRLTPGNIVETLGFFSDFCSGLLFLVAKFLGYSPGELPSPAADYGTKFLLVAGLLNVLCMLDAYDIAVGKKN